MEGPMVDDMHNDLPGRGGRRFAVDYGTVLDDTLDIRIARAVGPADPLIL